MKIGIGIDTGGTYTDAVVYDFTSKNILGSAKSLTTKYDLSVGILGALDGLPEEFIQKAEIISLSTTLATNACVEDKGGNAKLIFFGGDRNIIDKYGNEYGLPSSQEMYIQEGYTNFSGGMEREPDWELFIKNIEEDFNDLDGAGIIEMNAMKNGAVVEKKAKELFSEKYDIPVICGHELFSDLNCLQRGSSTLLNARLFPVIKEFLNAIKIAMAERNINADIVIVRSDGSLMSEEFASVRPVETLICGPAASVIGGTQLSQDSDSIIIDMGGTTTDISLLKNKIPVTVTDGVSIGKWKTFVNGLYVKTFGLGGDSAVHYTDRNLFLEDYRVIPLCVTAEKYPFVIDNLSALLATQDPHTKYLHEHYVLIKDISGNARYTNEEKAFCNALKDRPLIFKEAAAAIGKDIYTMNISRLLKDGIVQICGLTPTDIMHIKGDFNRFSAEASILGAKYAALNLNISVDKVCDKVYDEVKRKIYLNIIKVMLENKDPYYMKNGVNNDVERFINESYETSKSGKKNPLLSTIFQTEFSLVGIGAPIHIFLKDIAQMLGTTAVIPKYYEVANALGAVAGNICATHTVEIKVNYDAAGISGYTVFGNNESKNFDYMEDAEKFAIIEAKDGAYAEAVKRGARGNISVTCNLDKNDAPMRDGNIHLGTSVIAQAVGSIGF